MIVAIIPARGGSKRIPRKNIRNFAGKPIISYSIAAAAEAGLFDRIIVSTDSDEIADVARDCGAEVPFMRPVELSDDYTSTGEVLLHALSWLEGSGCTVDYTCCIYPTAPLLQPEYLRKGYDILRKSHASTVLSVTTYSFPVFRCLRVTDQGRLEMVWPENSEKRSQDLPATYHDAGQFIWVNARTYMLGYQSVFNNCLPVIIPRYSVQDIDTEEDWKRAELLFRLLEMEGESG